VGRLASFQFLEIAGVLKKPALPAVAPFLSRSPLDLVEVTLVGVVL
jgi:hypothetical protein